MAYSKKKRFVAGAVCPKCSMMDKVVVYTEDEKDWRECVSCGFKDEMRFQNHSAELDTRVNVTEEKLVEQTQVLQFSPGDQKH